MPRRPKPTDLEAAPPPPPKRAAQSFNAATDTDPERLALWRMTRDEAEGVYADAYQQDDIESLRWLGANDLYFLLTCLLRRPDVRNDWLYARCREVEADPYDHLDLWSREHYKSTIITFGAIIQEIIRNPEITIGIFSHDRPNAKKFMVVIKEEFEENAELKALYPEIFWQSPKKQARKWNEDEGIAVVRYSNRKEATVEAWGIDNLPTGRHFGLLVYDDIIDEKKVTNPDMIKSTTNQWELSLHLGERGGRVRMCGTRYHFGDTYGVILGRKVFKERRYPATDDGSFDGKPVFLTEKEWDRKKGESSKSTIAAQMLLNPLAGSDVTFDVRQLKFWEVRPKRLNVFIMADASKGRKAKADDTAICVIGVDINRNKYLLDGYRHRMTLSRRWEILRNTRRRWMRMPGIVMVNVGYEQFSMQTDIEYFEERMRAEEDAFPITELKWPAEGPSSKQHRIERLEPDIRMGRFRLPRVRDIDSEGRITEFDPLRLKNVQEAIARGERWRVAAPILKIDEDERTYDLIEKFLEEYTFFPFAPRDDFLDSASRIYDMEPEPPIVYDDGVGSPGSVEPEVFVDGP